jgi:hypothetical protein
MLCVGQREYCGHLPKTTFENANSQASLLDNSNKQAHGSSKPISCIEKTLM